jgi:hypothetical protein
MGILGSFLVGAKSNKILLNSHSCHLIQSRNLYQDLKKHCFMEEKKGKISKWDTMVHASFRKVVSFDLLFLGIGIVIGMGIGVYLIAGQ